MKRVEPPSNCLDSHGMKSLIIYLHGFRSSAESNKFRVLQEMFSDEKVISLDYSPHDPELASQQITKVILGEAADINDILVIGTSLGGFWARWAAASFGVKSILINPSLHPDITLKEGSYNSYQDPNVRINVTQKSLAQFEDYKVEPTSEAHALVLLAMDDNVINAYATKEELSKPHRVIFFEHGGHRFNQFSEMKEIIEDELNVFVPLGLTNE